ncbi:hypothetical protein ISCGN_015180 [Ixodes scapularis]
MTSTGQCSSGAPAAAVSPAPSQLRHPKVFAGLRKDDVEDWLDVYERALARWRQQQLHIPDWRHGPSRGPFGASGASGRTRSCPSPGVPLQCPRSLALRDPAPPPPCPLPPCTPLPCPALSPASPCPSSLTPSCSANSITRCSPRPVRIP